MAKDVITIVSGLPRSGTSMMMQMLAAGGMGLLTDGTRQADEDNPRGYFEVERVKELKKDTTWLKECVGKAVKVISMLLRDLPSHYTYKVIFMKREMSEILASQKIMLQRRGDKDDGVSDQEMAKKFEHHLKQVEDWLATQPNMEVFPVSYNETIRDPFTQAKKIAHFLGGNLNVFKMAEAVEKILYRQRNQ